MFTQYQVTFDVSLAGKYRHWITTIVKWSATLDSMPLSKLKILILAATLIPFGPIRFLLDSSSGEC